MSIRKMSIGRWAMAASVALAGALSVQAASAADESAPAIKVHYTDLELGSDAGVRSLYGRLQIAAHEVCGFAEPRDLARAAAARACYGNALASAVQRVSAPALTALYRQGFMGETAVRASRGA